MKIPPSSRDNGPVDAKHVAAGAMTSGVERPRLLVLTTTFPRWPGDCEPGFVFELAKRLTDHFDVTVLAPHAPGAREKEQMEGVQVYRFRYAPLRLQRLAYAGGIPNRLKRHPWLAFLIPWFLVAQFASAFRLVRRLRPHTLHAHWLLPSGLIGVLLKRLSGTRFRLLVTAHGADVHLVSRWPSNLLKRIALRSADQVAVVSHALREKIADELPSVHITVAPMGVDLQTRFVPASQASDNPTLVFAGRLVEKKGVSDLLQAMPAIIARIPHARLLIAGHGPLESELKALSEHLSLVDVVDFLGSVPNHQLPDVLRLGWLAVLPFRIAADGDQEGLGLVTIEAMGCGIPVIASDLPPIRDVIRDRQTGRLVPPGDPRRLAELAIELLEDRFQAMALASNARAEVLKKFDWQLVSQRYARLLSADIDA